MYTKMISAKEMAKKCMGGTRMMSNEYKGKECRGGKSRDKICRDKECKSISSLDLKRRLGYGSGKCDKCLVISPYCDERRIRRLLGEGMQREESRLSNG